MAAAMAGPVTHSTAEWLVDRAKDSLKQDKFYEAKSWLLTAKTLYPRNFYIQNCHKNIKLICDCLSKQITEFPSYAGDFVDNFVCSPNPEECMHGKCSQCPKFLDELEYDDTTVTWYEWERTTVSVPAKEGKDGSTTTTKKMQKVCKEGTVSDVLASLEKELNERLDSLCIKKYFTEAQVIPGISSFHCIEPDEDGFVNEENNLDEPVTKTRASTSKGTCCSDDLIFVEKTATSNSCTSSTSKETTQQCDVHMGLPHGLDTSTFVPMIPYSLPKYEMNEVEAVVGDLIQFNGDQLIGPADINALVNNSAPRSQDMWLTNFIIDTYFKLIKSSQENKRYESPLSYDLILVPCNTPNPNHWFLLAVLPHMKVVFVLDNRAVDYVKPPTQKAMNKMASVLSKLGANIEEWGFFCNTKVDIAQQSSGNDYDCGVYTCLYARCLADIGHMVEATSLPQFRNGILLELQRGALQQIPYPTIEREKYYAVHYQFNSTCKYYIGRVLSMEG
ncbi:predicted protein [Nematostella vectensis]|uniref:Integrator complex subunit 10 n=1 Tax=Nematostella vectensis TaxID=45351 RepID=A7SI39_NEMVE|nr:predicted protein [Nematostella vectensis]|eukprot:XP_001628687.1 predicted protein [Nematostella vectensis]